MLFIVDPEGKGCRGQKVIVYACDVFSREIIVNLQEANCMRRAALLDCFDSMQAACGKAWAQLSTEIAIEVLLFSRNMCTRVNFWEC